MATGTTIRQAQRAIDRAGIPLELVRGEGYHYFVYDQPRRGVYETVSIYVPYTNTYSAAEWAEQAAYAMEGIRQRLGRGY